MSDYFHELSPLYGLSQSQFRHLSDEDKTLLIRLIAMCSEKSFRRGFQQGWDSKERGDKVCDLVRWRFGTSLHVSVSPHGTYHDTAVHRLKTEIHLYQVGLKNMEDTYLSKDDIQLCIVPLFPSEFKKRGGIGKRLRFQVLRRDGFRCRYCGNSGDQSALHVDHVTPKADGGEDTLENLVTACADCNLGKGRSSAIVPTSEPATQSRHEDRDGELRRMAGRVPVRLQRSIDAYRTARGMTPLWGANEKEAPHGR